MKRVLSVPVVNVLHELEAAEDIVIAKTDSRSVLGTLNDFSFMLKWQLRDKPAPDLMEESLRLSRTPVAPLGPGWPDKVTLRLLGCDVPRFRGRAGSDPLGR